MGNYELTQALIWWNELSSDERRMFSGTKNQHLLTGREILTIFKQQNK